MKENQWFVICNPVSGKGKGLIALAEMGRIFDEQKLPFSYNITKEKLHASRLAREGYEKGFRKFAILGGDGTINEVINGIPNLDEVEIAIIPSGTGNDFALPLGIPEEPWDAIQTMLISPSKKVDIMEGNGIKTVCFATTGLDIPVVDYCNSLKYKDKKSYEKGIVKILPKYKSDDYQIIADGESFSTKAVFVGVVNGGILASGLSLCPPASATDGKIDVVIITSKGFFDSIKKFRTLKKGKLLLLDGIKHICAKEFEIIPKNLKTFDLDGELHQGESLKIKVLPKALNVIGAKVSE